MKILIGTPAYDLIEHMVAADKPVVGGIYPRRALDLNQVYALRDRIADSNVARLVAQDYVGAGTSIDFGEELDVGDNFDIEKMQVIPDKDGIFVGEDMAFCKRWVEGCGGEIWSVVTETILHVGTDRFVGRFLTKLEHGLA